MLQSLPIARFRSSSLVEYSPVLGLLTSGIKVKSPSECFEETFIGYVTSAGFEPATFGAEIRNSIQLNYEASVLARGK